MLDITGFGGGRVGSGGWARAMLTGKMSNVKIIAEMKRPVIA